MKQFLNSRYKYANEYVNSIEHLFPNNFSYNINNRDEYSLFSFILKQFKDGAFIISLDKLFHGGGGGGGYKTNIVLI